MHSSALTLANFSQRPSVSSFVGKKKIDKPVPLCLYGRELPWVSTATHLGVELSEDGTMDTDISMLP